MAPRKQTLKPPPPCDTLSPSTAPPHLPSPEEVGSQPQAPTDLPHSSETLDHDQTAVVTQLVCVSAV